MYFKLNGAGWPFRARAAPQRLLAGPLAYSMASRAAFRSVGGTAVLITDLHVLQVKRRGMAVSGAGGAPEAVGRPIGVFDGVQGVLHPRPHAVERDVLEI